MSQEPNISKAALAEGNQELHEITINGTRVGPPMTAADCEFVAIWLEHAWTPMIAAAAWKV